ncbi:MAG: DNA-binding transcriptional LysR family regulator [Myxococcota bacterium]
MHVTAAGRRLVEEARDPIADALAALVRTRAPDHVKGTVRIASTQSLAQAVLVPVLGELRRAHPELQVELSAQEGITPLVEGGFELAFRVGHMPDSSMIARKLATWRYLLVASPDWVAAHPEVHSPADLPAHWMHWGSTARAQQWTFQRGEDVLHVRTVRYPLVYDAAPLLVESARAGLGIVPMPPFCVERELAEGSLVRLLPEWQVRHELGIYGVTPHRTMLPARVHVVLEAVRARLGELAPEWEALTA